LEIAGDEDKCEEEELSVFRGREREPFIMQWAIVRYGQELELYSVF
jgi:hypothetical protein